MRGFVRRHNITAEAVLTDHTWEHMDDYVEGSRHWFVTLNRIDGALSGQPMRVPYTAGPAVEREPDAEHVLDCIALDSMGYENAQGSFEEWCGEYGYDTDSRKTEAIWRSVGEQYAKLKRLLTPAQVQQLLYQTEGL